MMFGLILSHHLSSGELIQAVILFVNLFFFSLEGVKPFLRKNKNKRKE